MMENFGERLCAAREAKGWTADALAEAAGVSLRRLSSWEHGRTVPDEAAIRRLSGILGYDLSAEAQEESAPDPVPRRAAAAGNPRQARRAMDKRRASTRRTRLGLIAAGVLLCAALLFAVALPSIRDGARPSMPAAPAFETVGATAEASPTPTAAPTATPTAVPTAEPEPTVPVHLQEARAAADYADPTKNGLLATRVYDAQGNALSALENPVSEIHMGASEEYAALEGVTTFRGSHYRDGGAFGVIPESPSRLSIAWTKRIGILAGWRGVGWTGQPCLVRWPEDVRARMNLRDDKRSKDGLIEAIYATLDGHIYFLDAEDGAETRKAINIGASVKGSCCVDPRGIPLLYCGQGLYNIDGKRVDCGTRIWSLIDQELLFFLDGDDKYALRDWKAFDCTPLVDGASDTMITAGENGVLYSVHLNTHWDGDSVSIAPEITRYVYKQARKGKLGTENSVAVYNHYAFFATNIGFVQCVDLNTMALVWSFDARDDIDASLVLEPEGDGAVGLYASNELDQRAKRGTCQMFKLNALTGELLWKRDSAELYKSTDDGSGTYGTPAVGKQDLSGIVYFHVSRTSDGRGMLYALDKRTGETVWEKKMRKYGWSSPTCVYTASGKGYVLIGSANGVLQLLDGLTGEAVAQVELHGNIEGSPAVFDDQIVVGTRGGQIYGIKIT